MWMEKMDDLQCLCNLVESMPRRLQDVLEGDGGYTKYKFVPNYTRNIIYFHFFIFFIFVSVRGRFLRDRPNLLSLIVGAELLYIGAKTLSMEALPLFTVAKSLYIDLNHFA